jgi:hypothetical protein
MLDAGGGSGSLAITTQPECTWEVSTNVNWISSLSPASGQGTTNVSFRVAANDGSSQRDGMLVVNGEQARVSQRAPCRYDVSPSNQSVVSSGGAGSLTIATASDCSWTAAAEVDWIAIASAAAGSGNGNVRFTVATNSGEARTGSITVGGQRATIAQAGAGASPACSATISPTTQNVGAAGGTGSIAVSAGNTCQWTASSTASWIAVTAGASGTGNGTVTFSVAANSEAARTGTLTIAGRTFTVSQSAAGSPPPPPPPPASCSYSISPDDDDVPMLGGAGHVDVNTTNVCSWTAASNAAWITIVSGGSGTGRGRVDYVVLPNIGASRTGTLTIAGETFTVMQAALVCSYSISPNNVKVSAAAGTASTSVTTSSTCAWTAASDASWITVTSGASGTGNGTVTFSFTQNTGKKERKAELLVAGKKFTVEQDN